MGKPPEGNVLLFKVRNMTTISGENGGRKRKRVGGRRRDESAVLEASGRRETRREQESRRTDTATTMGLEARVSLFVVYIWSSSHVYMHTSK